MNEDDERHGTSAGYNAGCREECCRTALADYARHRRTRHYLAGGPLVIDALGTKRRIRALMSLGWTALQVDAALDRERTYTANLLCGPDRIHRSTAMLVARAYEEMSTQLPDGRPDARPQVISRTRNESRRKGWAPPGAWLNIDDPSERPDPGYQPRRYTAAELSAEWDHLRCAGVSIHTAAGQLGVTVGAIEKAIERAGKEAVA